MEDRQHWLARLLALRHCTGPMPEVRLVDIATYYEGLPHQKEALQLLQQSMPDSLLKIKAAWHQKWIEESVQPEGVITPELMHDITGYRASSFDHVFCDDFNRMLADTRFSEHKEAEEMLMANILHETGGMIYFKELASGQAYEGRTDLGNTRPGDGPRFKGAGCLQLTGRYNYSRLAEALSDERVMEGVNYVADAHPFTSAETWIEENDLLNVCLNEGFEACCIRINGGTRGLNDRYRWYNIVKKAMGN